MKYSPGGRFAPGRYRPLVPPPPPQQTPAAGGCAELVAVALMVMAAGVLWAEGYSAAALLVALLSVLFTLLTS